MLRQSRRRRTPIIQSQTKPTLVPQLNPIPRRSLNPAQRHPHHFANLTPTNCRLRFANQSPTGAISVLQIGRLPLGAILHIRRPACYAFRYMLPRPAGSTSAATDTISYVATDQSELTATSTRTVIIEAPDANEGSASITHPTSPLFSTPCSLPADARTVYLTPCRLSPWSMSRRIQTSSY
jgi:hypothetical protein